MLRPGDLFEQFSEDYDHWFEEHPAAYHRELTRIRRHLPLPDPRVIEIGVGSGRFAGPLGIPLGLEPSLALAHMARGRGIEVIRGVGEAIPIRDGAFSSALLVTVICFLIDPVPVFLELHRILAPKGRVVIGFLERGLYQDDKRKHRFLSQARFYSAEEVQALLKHAGFRVTEVESKAWFTIIAAEKSSP